MSKHFPLNYLPSIIAVIAVGLLAFVFDVQSREFARQATRADVASETEVLRARLQSQIVGGLHLGQGLASYLSRSEELSQTEFSQFVSEIFSDLPEVINVAWAPDLVVIHVHPIKGNEKTIGLDYRNVPAQIDSVVKARDTGQVVLVGPVDLVQGGQGFIFRVPVYAPGEDSVLFKGMLSLVFDMDAFLNTTGVTDSDIATTMRIDTDDMGLDTVFFGPRDLLGDDPVTAQILVPGGSWSIYTRPAEGWKAAESPLFYNRLLMVFVAALILFPMVTANILAVSRQKTIREMEITDSRMKSVMKNVPGVYTSYCMFDDGRERLDFLTDGSKDIWGIEKEEALANSQLIWDRIDPDFRQELKEEIERARNTLTPWHFIWPVTTTKGERKWLEGHGQMTAMSDGIVRRDSFIADITEKKERDEEFTRQAEIVRQTQKQESIGLLTGGVAHDFNNLLAVVRGSLELLRDDIADENIEDDDRLNIIATAIQASDRGADLTKSMLSFARRARLIPEIIDLNDVVRETEAWAGRTLPATIDVQIDLQTSLPRIRVDRSSTASALLNLIVNARDAMTGGGTLVIQTALENLKAGELGSDGDLTPGSYVVLSISDTGEGIPQTIIDRIFEPFFSTKHPGKGSGLGLSMVEGFIKQSGGTIRVTSTPGQGTTIKLYFKALDGNVSDLPSAQDPGLDTQPASLRILVAEDDDGVRAILEATLGRLGHRVQAQPSGDAALEAFRNDTGFDLLITDIVMPGKLQGTDLAHEVRQIDPGLPVIFLSGYARDAEVGGSELGVTDIRLMKPVRRKVLAEAIARAMAAKYQA
ncbi:Blue-light-activated protein [Thalassovita gelatinovora]|uniref:histidine kinase n=1 Tax=Thalassovita gelatinovora TaxID=53501 RepID=A0A0P1G870_THAGE|nr:ATP-binding protein [Thalassovita gelatinovora]QIZ82200.1 response regulator [Thalassovita gelatinovora]CUH67829.1 Blue-light-activated protein [Thalassovita gelatinovora]SEP66389.1 PAS domain S-box-containing protein [Thalassovita gelatinovora]